MNCYNINKHKLVIVHMSSSSRLGAGVWLAYGVAPDPEECTRQPGHCAAAATTLGETKIQKIIDPV